MDKENSSDAISGNGQATENLHDNAEYEEICDSNNRTEQWDATQVKLDHLSPSSDQNSQSRFHSLKITDLPSSCRFETQAKNDTEQCDVQKPDCGKHKVDIAKKLYLQARKARSAMNHRKSADNCIYSCVFGGESAVYYVWRNQKVMPYCIFVAEDILIPGWIDESEKSVPIIRCPQSVINSMLSARKNENYAGHFPAPPVVNAKEITKLVSEIKLRKNKAPSRILVLHMIRDPMNLGHLIKAAVSFGFKHVIVIGCASLHNEKLIRASEGVIYDSSLCAFEVPTLSPGILQQLTDLSGSGNLLACFAVPDQDVQSVTSFARKLSELNNEVSIPTKDDLLKVGVMLFLGSEHHGLQTLINEWRGKKPDFVSIHMANPLLESLNVAHAGSILMHALRPEASPQSYLTSKRACNM